MVTSREKREVKEWLHNQMADIGIIEERRPMTTWYRPNGRSFEGPADAYHIQRYRAKGFTLKPQVESKVVDFPGKAEEESAVVPHSFHKYLSVELGTPCQVEGCSKTRTSTPQASRRK